MSPYHFLRTFRQVAGMTPHQFVLRTRLHRAAVRLRTSDEPISAIAFDAGFGDLSGAPDIYFETDHYKGWPAVLIRLVNISDAELKHRIGRAWRMRAPKRLVVELDAKRGSR